MANKPREALAASLIPASSLAVQYALQMRHFGFELGERDAPVFSTPHQGFSPLTARIVPVLRQPATRPIGAPLFEMGIRDIEPQSTARRCLFHLVHIGTFHVAVQSQVPATAGMPTIDPLLADWRAVGMEPFCLQLADTDGDGQKEWLGLIEGRGGDVVGIRGFVLDGGRLNMLGGQGTGMTGGVTLGDDPVCQASVRDLNADGLVEIAVAGQRQDGSKQLSIFVWDDAGSYRLIAQLGGSERADLVDDDHNGVAEIVVANRFGPGVWLEEVSAWDGRQYIASSSRYVQAPAFQGALPSSTPEQALIGFYLSLQRRDMAAAYEYLSPAMRQRQGYEPFLLSAAAVERFDLGEVHQREPAGETVAFTGPLQIHKIANGKSQQERYTGEWRLAQTETGWRIDAISLVPAAN